MGTSGSCSIKRAAQCAVFFVALGRLSVVSAQTAPETADFLALSRIRTATVVDDTGQETTGRLVRVTADALTMRVDGRERVFERTRVTTVHEVGDPLTNGLLIGLVAGGTFGAVGGAFLNDCGGWYEVRECSSSESVQNAALAGAVYGAIGLGIGAAIDRLVVRRTLRYARVGATGTGAVSLTVAPGVAGARVLIGIGW